MAGLLLALLVLTACGLQESVSPRFTPSPTSAKISPGDNEALQGESPNLPGHVSPTRNARASYLDFAGWGGGYGHLVKMDDRYYDYIAYYAHLSDINYENLMEDPPSPPPEIIPQGVEVGLSGESGDVTGAHLHFHVQSYGGAAIDLNGMVNLTLNADYPNCGDVACTDETCLCGDVN